jgi:hypothetical protein
MKNLRSKKELSLSDMLLRKDNILRDIVISTIAVGLLTVLVINQRRIEEKRNEAVLPPQLIIETTPEQEIPNEAENPVIDTANWLTYGTQWYGFELKYPEDWNKPQVKSASRDVNWEYRYQFRKKEMAENNPYSGFDVVIYSVKDIQELSNTDEFQAIKNGTLKLKDTCQEIGEHIAENENYPAEQIYIGQNDECYYPAYFYTLTRDNYIYNIVPVVLEEKEKTVRSEEEVIKNFPEFISASSTFNLIDIKRPKPVPPKPKITAPKPVGKVKRDSLGRRVCVAKSDDPKKSSQNKKKHLDMECCLDPDEYPNPHCYYDPKKYGKYL